MRRRRGLTLPGLRLPRNGDQIRQMPKSIGKVWPNIAIRRTGVGATDVELEVGKDYRSRRGEQVRITEIEPQGLRPVHFVVLTGPYKGVGAKDGSCLTR